MEKGVIEKALDTELLAVFIIGNWGEILRRHPLPERFFLIEEKIKEIIETNQSVNTSVVREISTEDIRDYVITLMERLA